MAGKVLRLKIFTIGFTKTSAESFFARLEAAGVRRVVDVRLHNVSQLAGFAKRTDLEYFLRVICEIDYVHRPELAPTKELLDGYRKGVESWASYEQRFDELMVERRVEQLVSQEELDGSCLLCSEDEPSQCHRRLVAEYFRAHWDDVEIEHL